MPIMLGVLMKFFYRYGNVIKSRRNSGNILEKKKELVVYRYRYTFKLCFLKKIYGLRRETLLYMGFDKAAGLEP
jgi:hypothetical protein